MIKKGGVIDIRIVLFDQETIMRNHDASVVRRGWQEGRKEGRKEGQQSVAKLMNYLLTNDRGEDAMRATQDEEYLNRLLSEYAGD